MPRRFSTRALALVFLGLAVAGHADDHVALVGRVSPDYFAARQAGGKLRRESYVFMAGRRFEGATVDRSFDRTTIRQIADYLAPKLTAQNYWPARTVAEADLVLVVHWGVTMPQVSFAEAAGQTTIHLENPDNAAQPGGLTSGSLSESTDAGPYQPGIAEGSSALDQADLAQQVDRVSEVADAMGSSFGATNSARLLGYAETLRKLRESPFPTAEEYTLRQDLRAERYFVIVRAYDLRGATAEHRRRPVWVMHMNISSPGNDFRSAVGLMSSAAADHFGRETDGVRTIRATPREGRVEIGELMVLGEAR